MRNTRANDLITTSPGKKDLLRRSALNCVYQHRQQCIRALISRDPIVSVLSHGRRSLQRNTLRAYTTLKVDICQTSEAFAASPPVFGLFDGNTPHKFRGSTFIEGLNSGKWKRKEVRVTAPATNLYRTGPHIVNQAIIAAEKVNSIKLSREANEKCRRSLGGYSTAQDRWEYTMLLGPLAGGGGACCPSPRIPTPLSTRPAPPHISLWLSVIRNFENKPYLGMRACTRNYRVNVYKIKR